MNWLKHPIAPWLIGVCLILSLTNLYPLLLLMQRAFSLEGVFSLSNIQWLLETPRVSLALRHSLFVSLSATILALVGGLSLAIVTTKTDLPGRMLIRALFLSPLVIPPQILALAWLQWAGPVGYLQQFLRGILILHRQGPLWSLYNPGGIILLLTLFVLPITYLTLSSGLSRVQRQTEEAARLDGAGILQVWFYITLPLLRPYLGAAAVLAFLGSLSNFGIPAFLGIPGRYITLPTLLYQEVINFSRGGLGHSAALALLFGLPAITFLGLQNRLLRHDEGGLEPTTDLPDPYPLGKMGWLWGGILGLITLLVIVGPLFAMTATALLKAYGLPLTWANLTLENFRFILFDLVRARRAAWHSLGLATGAALICTSLAVIVGYSVTRIKGRGLALLRLIVDLPYALPGLIFALSLILVWLPSPIPGISLYGTIWLLLIAYLGRFLAFSLQPIHAAWLSLDKSLEESASIDGASLFQSFRFILLPLIAPALVAAVLLVFLQALAELTLSALLAGSGTETLGWLVFGLQQGGYTNQAAALSTLLVVILFGVAAIVARLRPQQI
ncbi:MAG: ABC transporter permease [Cyanophyceae cyanobacterium]